MILIFKLNFILSQCFNFKQNVQKLTVHTCGMIYRLADTPVRMTVLASPLYINNHLNRFRISCMTKCFICIKDIIELKMMTNE